MFNTILQNEMNRQYREVSTMAMIESQKQKEAKQILKAEIQQPLFIPKCDIFYGTGDSITSIVFVCFMVLKYTI